MRLQDQQRRLQLRSAGAAAIAALLPACGASPQVGGSTTIGFAGVSASDAVVDGLRLPRGYVARAVAVSGDAVGSAGQGSAATADGAGAQPLQVGLQPGGVRFVPLDGSNRGLLVVNHGSAGGNDGAPPTAALQAVNAVNVLQTGHGISVCEVALRSGSWQVLRPSKLARRLNGTTPMPLAGPAAGHLLMRTAADPAGRSALGTIGNGGVATTPWGTILSGEAGWAGCFAVGAGATADQRRYGIGGDTAGGWPQLAQRFDARRHPNEFHRFGWVVEFDPLDAAAPAVKRTALGRAAHGGLCATLAKDGRAVVYGTDAGPFEPVWKFVSDGRMAPPAAGRSAAQVNRALLDTGTLHVARFDADGSGQWLPLLHGQGGLLPSRGFADAAEVLIKARQAGDAVNATRLPRAAALAIAPDGDVVCALAGDPARSAAALTGSDADRQTRIDDPAGGVIRWKEAGSDAGAASFRWSRLSVAPGAEAAVARAEVAGGDAPDARPAAAIDAAPHAAAFDGRGVLWLAAVNVRQPGPGRRHRLLACDLAGETVRSLLDSAAGGAIGGIGWTSDFRTLFVSVQQADAAPGAAGLRRSAVVAIRRSDGGIIGA